MPVTEVICPNCGNQMRANALNKAGVIGSPCRECQERVLVETDNDGDVIGIFIEDGSGVSDDEDEAEYEDSGSGGGFGYFDTGILKSFLLPVALLMGLLVVAWIASSVYTTRPQLAVVKTPTPLAEDTPEPVREPSATPAVATPVPGQKRPVLPKVMVLDGLSGVHFAQNQAILPPESRIAFVDVITRIKAAPAGSLFEIGGHTDNEGSEAYNRQLSLRRAEAVRAYLVAQGVPSTRLRVKGYGATKPVVSNESELGKEQNRRIEFTQIK